MISSLLNRKRVVFFIIITLFISKVIYSQIPYGKFINLTDTLIINCNNEVSSTVLNQKKGFLYENIVIFNSKDSFEIKQYKNKYWYYLVPILPKGVCKARNYDFFYLEEEYWPDCTIKQVISWHFFNKGGFKRHGISRYYDKTGKLIYQKKFKKGKLIKTMKANDPCSK